MEHVEKRISYLRGLADGFAVGEASREGKILVDLIQVIDDLAAEIDELHLRLQEAEQYVEAVDEDLSDLEYMLFDDAALYEVVEDDEEAGEYADLDDSEDAFLYETTGEAGEAAYGRSYEFECPSCRETILFHEGIDEEGYRHYLIEPSREEAAINPT
ncbi:CD1247 N-terminal domain-containing protein [Brevibacillus marinus]|uniref:CD1247 N-terminal domain-containing protein n=1 Tax=Brevibacillus marinus TaxID=2496837 RepID=UPI000F820C19|nr:CD1247 N-terminal domain-containing protein [Brevibacillus marinus]